jgi:hypothetical protein
LKKSWTLAVSVAINISMLLCFVSVHGPRETYFVDEPRTRTYFSAGTETVAWNRSIHLHLELRLRMPAYASTNVTSLHGIGAMQYETLYTVNTAILTFLRSIELSYTFQRYWVTQDLKSLCSGGYESSIFRDITPCSQAKKRTSIKCCFAFLLFHASFFLGSLFDLE